MYVPMNLGCIKAQNNMCVPCEPVRSCESDVIGGIGEKLYIVDCCCCLAKRLTRTTAYKIMTSYRKQSIEINEQKERSLLL